MAKTVTFKHPIFGSNVSTTPELRDIIMGKAERPGPVVALSQEETQPLYDQQAEEPAGNASTEEWRDFRLEGGYSESDIEGLGRDELKNLD